MEHNPGLIVAATRPSHAPHLLVEVDHQSKSGVGDAAENVERFLLAVGGEMALAGRR